MADDVGIEPLDRAQCLALLRTASIGRVVFTRRAMPAVQPVRFALHDDAVLFAVPSDSALYAGARDTVVAFEVDEFAHDLGAGWYVSLLGWASDAGELLAASVGCLCPCPPVAGRRYLRIPVEAITGRRITCRAE